MTADRPPGLINEADPFSSLPQFKKGDCPTHGADVYLERIPGSDQYACAHIDHKEDEAIRLVTGRVPGHRRHQG